MKKNENEDVTKVYIRNIHDLIVSLGFLPLTKANHNTALCLLDITTDECERLELLESKQPRNDRYFCRKFSSDYIVVLGFRTWRKHPHQCFELTCSVSHLPTSRLLAQITGGRYLPLEEIYWIGALDKFVARHLKLLRPDGATAQDVRMAPAYLTEEMLKLNIDRLLSAHELALLQDFLPWLESGFEGENRFQRFNELNHGGYMREILIAHLLSLGRFDIIQDMLNQPHELLNPKRSFREKVLLYLKG